MHQSDDAGASAASPPSLPQPAGPAGPGGEPPQPWAMPQPQPQPQQPPPAGYGDAPSSHPVAPPPIPPAPSSPGWGGGPVPAYQPPGPYGQPQPPGVPGPPGPYGQAVSPPRAGAAPLTLPGWGAVPAVVGIALVALGLFALHWHDDASFLDIRSAVLRLLHGRSPRGAREAWVVSYLAFVAFGVAVAALVPVLWAVGAFRTLTTAWLLMGTNSKRLREGNAGPARARATVWAVACLAYHVGSWFPLTGNDLGALGPGPWVLLVGSALIVVGAFVGPRVAVPAGQPGPAVGYPPAPAGYVPGPQAPPVPEASFEANPVAALFAVAGAALLAIGLFAVDWAPGTSLSRLRSLMDGASTSGFRDGWAHYYVGFFVFLLAGTASLQAVMWTLSVRKYPWMALLIPPGRGDTPRHRGDLNRVRTAAAVLSVCYTLVHLLSLVALTHGHLGNLKAGPWWLLAGYLVLVPANALGPVVRRPTPAPGLGTGVWPAGSAAGHTGEGWSGGATARWSG